MGQIKKHYIVYFVLLLQCLMLYNKPLQSQTTSFIYYGVEQGLSQSQVQDLVQDDDGNLWIGTLSGLTKYNGQEFKTFSRKDSLAEDWITAMCKDVKGNIWLGHWAGGVSMYNYKTKKIVHYFDDGIVAEGQNNLKVVVTDNVGNSAIFETQFFRSQIKK